MTYGKTMLKYLVTSKEHGGLSRINGFLVY